MKRKENFCLIASTIIHDELFSVWAFQFWVWTWWLPSVEKFLDFLSIREPQETHIIDLFNVQFDNRRQTALLVNNVAQLFDI